MSEETYSATAEIDNEYIDTKPELRGLLIARCEVDVHNEILKKLFYKEIEDGNPRIVTVFPISQTREEDITKVSQKMTVSNLIRCKDCKYAKKISQSWLGLDLYCVSCERLCDEFPVLMNENDFCSRGVRKEETE